jgi:hypothetical protein
LTTIGLQSGGVPVVPSGHFGATSGVQARPFQRSPSGQHPPFGMRCVMGQTFAGLPQASAGIFAVALAMYCAALSLCKTAAATLVWTSLVISH